MPTTRPQTSKVSCAAGPARPDGELKRNGDVGSSRCPSRARARELGAIKVNATLNRGLSMRPVGDDPVAAPAPCGRERQHQRQQRSPESPSSIVAPKMKKFWRRRPTAAQAVPRRLCGAGALPRTRVREIRAIKTNALRARWNRRAPPRARDHSQYGQRPDMGNETPCRPSIKRSPSGTEGMHSPRRREKIAAHLCWTRWVFRIAAPTVYLGSTKLPSRTIPHWLSIMYASHLSNP